MRKGGFQCILVSLYYIVNDNVDVLFEEKIIKTEEQNNLILHGWNHMVISW